MSETNLESKKEFGTALTKVTDMFMPLIMGQMEKNNIAMTPYAKQCVMHSISAINAVLDKSGVSWNSPQLDKSTVSDILVKIACFQLNAAASPRGRIRKRYLEKADRNGNRGRRERLSPCPVWQGGTADSSYLESTGG